MTYSIGEVSERFGLTTYTIRYYDKEGLLPFVDKNKNGVRVFKASDLEVIELIECLKRTGMPIKDIKKFMDWCMEGDSTLQKRYDMFQERKAETEKQLALLQKTLEKINYKCWYYETALAAGTEQVHK